MTEKRNTRQSGAETDPLVTRTYREIADESTPEHLNRTILKEAAKAARPRYRRFISWTRPMAWAATVMLSVALVLEITKTPTPESMMIDDSLGKFEIQERDTDSSTDAPSEALEESESPATPPGRLSNPGNAALPQSATAKFTAKQAAPEPEKRQRGDVQQNGVVEQKLTAPAESVEEIKLKDVDMLHRAEDMARLQDGENKERPLASDPAATMNAEMAVQGAAAPSVRAEICDETDTASPETWLDCIIALEESGQTDEARLQREHLSKAFPDFDLP